MWKASFINRIWLFSHSLLVNEKRPSECEYETRKSNFSECRWGVTYRKFNYNIERNKIYLQIYFSSFLKSLEFTDVCISFKEIYTKRFTILLGIFSIIFSIRYPARYISSSPTDIFQFLEKVMHLRWMAAITRSRNWQNGSYINSSVHYSLQLPSSSWRI